MPKSESKKDPVVKVEFHYESGNSLVVPLYDETSAQGIPTELVEKYKQLSKKAGELEQEAWKLSGEACNYMSPEDLVKKTIEGIKVIKVTREEL